MFDEIFNQATIVEAFDNYQNIITLTVPSIEDAQAYFDARLSSNPWDDATEVDQGKALIMATKIVNSLYIVQLNNISTPPQACIEAIFEIAISLLDGIDVEMEYKNLVMISQSYDSQKTVYDRTINQDHIIHGVPSIIAWRLLKPYMKDNLKVNMVRRS